MNKAEKCRERALQARIFELQKTNGELALDLVTKVSQLDTGVDRLTKLVYLGGVALKRLVEVEAEVERLRDEAATSLVPHNYLAEVRRLREALYNILATSGTRSEVMRYLAKQALEAKEVEA